MLACKCRALLQIVSEVRSTRRGQEQRRLPGPPPPPGEPRRGGERGRLSRLEDGLRHFVFDVTLYFDAVVSGLIAWLLLSALFDACAVFAVPVQLRRLAGGGAAPS